MNSILKQIETNLLHTNIFERNMKRDGATKTAASFSVVAAAAIFWCPSAHKFVVLDYVILCELVS